MSILLGAELTLFPAQIVSSTTSAAIGIRRVPGATLTTYFEKQSVPLCQLFLHCISNRHFGRPEWRMFSVEYMIAVSLESAIP